MIVVVSILKLTKVCRPPRSDDLSMRAALEDDGTMARTLAVGESADCLRALVIEASKELVELLRAESVEEPFARISALSKPNKEEVVVRGVAYTYGPGSSSKASKQRHVSSTSTGPSIYENIQSIQLKI